MVPLGISCHLKSLIKFRFTLSDYVSKKIISDTHQLLHNNGHVEQPLHTQACTGFNWKHCSHNLYWKLFFPCLHIWAFYLIPCLSLNIKETFLKVLSHLPNCVFIPKICPWHNTLELFRKRFIRPLIMHSWKISGRYEKLKYDHDTVGWCFSK